VPRAYASANRSRRLPYKNSLGRRCEAMSSTLAVTMMMIRIAEVVW
jgi:hypothetical protein